MLKGKQTTICDPKIDEPFEIDVPILLLEKDKKKGDMLQKDRSI